MIAYPLVVYFGLARWSMRSRGLVLLGLPALLPYPEHFPLRSVSMLVGLLTLVGVSLATRRR